MGTNIKTLNLNKLSLLIGLFLVSAFFTTSANAMCIKVGDVITTVSGETPVKDSGAPTTATDQCSDTPDAYRVVFYKLAICTADTKTNDLSSCQYIINSAAGKTIDIEYPASQVLDIPEFSIDPGTYPYMVAVIGSRLGIKHAWETSSNTGGAGSGEGKFCWTSNTGTTSFTNEAFASSAHGVTTIADGIAMATCGAESDSAPVFTYEIINILTGELCSDGFGANGDTQNFGAVAGGNGSATVALLDTANAFATACANSHKILWTTLLTTPHVVTEDSTFELKMRTQGAVSMDFSGDDDNEFIKTGADPIQLNLYVN